MTRFEKSGGFSVGQLQRVASHPPTVHIGQHPPTVHIFGLGIFYIFYIFCIFCIFSCDAKNAPPKVAMDAPPKLEWLSKKNRTQKTPRQSWNRPKKIPEIENAPPKLEWPSKNPGDRKRPAQVGPGFFLRAKHCFAKHCHRRIVRFYRNCCKVSHDEI